MYPKVLIRFLFGGPVVSTWPAEIGLLVLRLVGGLGLALLHGRSKVFDPAMFEQFSTGVEQLGFPLPGFSTWAAALGELVGGLLLAMGLFTRLAALWVMGVMVGAAFVAHGGSFTGAAPLAEAEMAVLYLVIGFCFLMTGSSRTGLDQLIWRRYTLSDSEAEIANFQRRQEALAGAARGRGA